MLVYALTIVIVSSWLIKMILAKKIIYQKTFLEIPFLLYFLSHLLSTIFSLDPHTSIWGYYSRFHEGLLSTASYSLLYFAAVSNLDKDDVKKIFYAALAAGVIVSVWAIFEHFGHSFSCLLIPHYQKFDVGCWVQDVQNRVYATLGQPNWLAAYLAILIPVSLSFWPQSRIFFFLTPLFFTALLFTKSRSGILGLFVGLAILMSFWLVQNLSRFCINNSGHPRSGGVARMTVIGILFAIIIFIFGLPFSQTEKYSLEKFLTQKAAITQPTPPPSADILISESADIRKPVWEAAVKIWQRYPLLGSGVETFAYSYYKDRPASKNLDSEWDFLYNKAHNEYLNLLATTGTIGISTYFLIIGAFLVWSIYNFQFTIFNKFSILKFLNSSIFQISLVTAYISILITNYIGFSVVIVGLYFFLIPAFCYLLTLPALSPEPSGRYSLVITPKQWAVIIIIILGTLYLEFKLLDIWRADTHYALSQNYQKANSPVLAYQEIDKAVKITPGEPLYHNEKSQIAATLTLAAKQENEATLAGQIAQIAISESNAAVSSSPNNVAFFKTRVRVFSSLSQLDPQYLVPALQAITRALDLAPTDAKIHYFHGILTAAAGQTDQAIAILENTIKLKPNYSEAIQQLEKLKTLKK